MDREGFRNRLKQYKLAREENPGLKYWEWKDIPKYAEGENEVEETYYDNRVSTEENPILYVEKSPKQKYEETLTRYGRTDLDAYNARKKEASKYTIPYIPEKQIMLTTDRYNTGKISTNLLDSIYDSAQRVGVPIDIALGLAGRESTLGIGRGFKNGQDISMTDLYSNWQQIQPVIATKNMTDTWNNLVKKQKRGELLTDADWAFRDEFLKFGKRALESTRPIKEHPIDNALKLYSTGRYNAGDKRYEQKVQKDAQLIMSDPAIQKWAKEKGIAYAEGTDGVTGPPTYEQWDADMNQHNPTILDNASMYWSIKAAKKALHNEAMGLPGYAERWTEYYRSLPKNDPDINEFVDELWANENPNNVGYRNGKYYPHKSPEGGKMTIGPGFKLDSGSHGISTKTANRGMTKTRLNQEARKIGKQHLKAVDQFINYGQTTNPADTVSPQIKMGLMDLRHLVGPLNEWSNLRLAVLEGDLDRIKKESTVTWNDNGKIKVDKRRKKIRDEKYFYYE